MTRDERRRALASTLRKSGLLGVDTDVALAAVQKEIADVFEQDWLVEGDDGQAVVDWMKQHQTLRELWPIDKQPPQVEAEPPPQKPEPVPVSGPDISYDPERAKREGLAYYHRAKAQAAANNSRLVVEDKPSAPIRPGLGEDEHGPVYNVPKASMTGDQRQYERLRQEAKKHGARLRFFE